MSDYTDRYWSDQLFRERRRAYAREKMAQNRQLARAARRDLRSFMRMGLPIARLIRRHIDIESASDARVIRFYRSLKWRL